MKEETFEIEFGGKTLSATFTDLADQTNASVIVRYGDTAVITNVVMAAHERGDVDYFPLSVEFEEKFYAAGKILGSRFMRREGKPTDSAILSGRIIDRTIRPLFNHSLRRDIQVVTTVLALAEEDPDVLGVNAASIALATSDIPWNGPVSAVRVGKMKGESTFIINPAHDFRNNKDVELDMLLCGKDGVVTMIEVGAHIVSESVLIEALARGMEEIEKLQLFQKELVEKIGKEKEVLETKEVAPEIAEEFKKIQSAFETKVFSGTPGKGPMHELKKAFMDAVAEKNDGAYKAAGDYYESRVETLMRERAIQNGERVDGRALDEVRPLFAQAGGLSNRLHGTGIFYRGGTHVLSVLTLGGPDDSQLIDSIEDPEYKKRFMHHYNFPPYSVGETGRIGAPNRRMIGHGALAEKALEPVIPNQEEFPYTIRLVSEALASNGSTSMGSVCGSTLALMDGGVPITAPVAGIAMGIMYNSSNEYAILTDIQGPEDHHGDMDFKVAGTREGVTAIQLDVKVEGVPIDVLKEALDAAKVARLQILEVIEKAIAVPREKVSAHAPTIVPLTIRPDMIGIVIGSQGKTIKKIQEDTGVTDITIEDDGRVYITGTGDAPSAAAKIIQDLTHTFEVGEFIEGPVTRILDFGAFVRLNSRTEGLVHISEIAPFRIEKVRDAISEGEVVKVVVKEIDEQGRVNLSIKAIDPDFAERKGITPGPAPEHHGGNNRKNS